MVNSTFNLTETENSEDDFLTWFTPKVFPYIAFPLISIFGIPFNILSFITIIKSSLWNTTLFRYMAFVSLADFFVIIAYSARGLAYAFIGQITELAFTILYCNVFLYTYATFGIISSMCLTAVTFDRYLCIAFPTKAKVWSTLGICNKVIFCVCFIWIFANMHCFFVQNKSTRFSSNRIECTPTVAGGVFFFKYWLVFLGILYSIVPMILLGILNFLIIKNLKKHSTETESITNKGSDDKLKVATRKLTILNICISTTFILLTSPIVFCNLYIRYVSKNFNNNIGEKLAFEITFMLNAPNHVINFIFYCVFGKTFREELIKLFKSTKKNNRSTISRISS